MLVLGWNVLILRFLVNVGPGKEIFRGRRQDAVTSCALDCTTKADFRNLFGLSRKGREV